MSGRYALIIANTKYTDRRLAQLAAPSKDAEEFARVLKSEDIGAFDEVIVLMNKPESIARRSIAQFFSNNKPDDLLLLYFSGHGIRDEQGQLFLATKDTDHTILDATSLPAGYITRAMNNSRSRRQVLILDCCNSGAFAQGTKAAAGGSVGTASAFEGTGYGRVVLTASDSTQYAWEGDRLIGETVNSLFTHFLVKGLDGEADTDGDGTISVDELYDYAYEQIVNITPKQTPGKWSYKQQGEIILRQSMRIEDIRPMSLPTALLDSIENPFPDVRLGAVQQLTKLLSGKNLGLARSARETLERIAEEDDSRTVSRAAFQALEPIRQAEQLRLQKAEEERLAAEKLEAERRSQEEAERLAKQKAEEERVVKAKIEAELLAAEKAVAERKARVEAERLAAQKAQEERITKAEMEAKRLAEEKRIAADKIKAQQEVAKKTTGKVIKTGRSSWLTFGIIGTVIIVLALCGYGAMEFLLGIIGAAAPGITPTEIIPTAPSVDKPSETGARSVAEASVGTETPSPTDVLTPTLEPTLEPTAVPSFVQLPRQWNGTYSYLTGEKQNISLIIENLNGTTFTGKMVWQSFSDVYRGAILRMNGEYVTDFGGEAEQIKWNNLEDYKNGDRSGTWLKWTETEIIKGANYTVNGWYYAHIREGGTMVAVYFFNKDEIVADKGSFILKPAVP